jgi:hypothetical protein
MSAVFLLLLSFFHFPRITSSFAPQFLFFVFFLIFFYFFTHDPLDIDFYRKREEDKNIYSWFLSILSLFSSSSSWTDCTAESGTRGVRVTFFFGPASRDSPLLLWKLYILSLLRSFLFSFYLVFLLYFSFQIFMCFCVCWVKFRLGAFVLRIVLTPDDGHGSSISISSFFLFKKFIFFPSYYFFV